MNKLRLLVWDTCNRNCPGCCNKDWDLDQLPVCEDFSPYDMVMLTGGEPMLDTKALHKIIHRIRLDTKDETEIIIYTAKVDDCAVTASILYAVDGMTVTLHNQTDVKPFLLFAHAVRDIGGSLRVKIFKGVDLACVPLGWTAKPNMEWQENCPLPNDEVFMRLN